MIRKIFFASLVFLGGLAAANAESPSTAVTKGDDTSFGVIGRFAFYGFIGKTFQDIVDGGPGNLTNIQIDRFDKITGEMLHCTYTLKYKTNIGDNPPLIKLSGCRVLLTPDAVLNSGNSLTLHPVGAPVFPLPTPVLGSDSKPRPNGFNNGAQQLDGIWIVNVETGKLKGCILPFFNHVPNCVLLPSP